MDINVNLSGLDALAASIESLADALKAGVTANQIIDTAKQSSRKPRTPAPAAAPVVEAGNAPTDTATSATPASTAPAAETQAPAAEPSKPASPSEPAAETKPPEAAPASKPTIAQVRAAIAKLAQTDKARALEILSKRGAASVSALAEEHYAAALAEATK